MDSNSVWSVLSNIPIGIIVTWVVSIASIIAVICVGIIKLYKVFTKYSQLKRENEDQKALIQKHDTVLIEVNELLQGITTSLNEQKQVSLKQIRHMIIHICDDAIAAERISAGKLRLLEELYSDYVDIFKGNGYVKTLVVKVRTLPVMGKLDE